MVAAGRPSPPRSLPGAAAPVGERLRLVRLDDAAAEFAGLGEQLLQLVALAPADGPLQVAQVLAEALPHLQHRLAVLQEDVAPHDREIGRASVRRRVCQSVTISVVAVE